MGNLFVAALRREGLRDDAQQVNQLLKKIASAKPTRFFTVSQVATKLKISEEMVSKFVSDGKFASVMIDDECLIPEKELDPFSVLLEIDEEVPDVPMEQINAIMQEWRKDWTWIGKEN